MLKIFADNERARFIKAMLAGTGALALNACGMRLVPEATPTATSTPKPTDRPTQTPTATATPRPTETATPYYGGYTVEILTRRADKVADIWAICHEPILEHQEFEQDIAAASVIVQEEVLPNVPRERRLTYKNVGAGYDFASIHGGSPIEVVMRLKTKNNVGVIGLAAEDDNGSFVLPAVLVPDQRWGESDVSDWKADTILSGLNSCVNVPNMPLASVRLGLVSDRGRGANTPFSDSLEAVEDAGALREGIRQWVVGTVQGEHVYPLMARQNVATVSSFQKR
jgi:hypothetical protein